MQLDEYLHERDLYYVVHEMHMMSLALEGPYSLHTYKLTDHRTISAPNFKDQRKLIRYLSKENVILLEEILGKTKKKVDVDKGYHFKFRRTDDDKLRHFHNELQLKKQEAMLNYISMHDYERIYLSIEAGFIYLQTPTLKLRINNESFRANSIPESFFIYLIEKANGEEVSRTNFPHKTNRSFSDMVTKAGFHSKLRDLFVPILDKDTVRLMPSIDAKLKDIVIITRDLVKADYNKNVYEKYMEGIN